jgi:hypothetical protein
MTVLVVQHLRAAAAYLPTLLAGPHKPLRSDTPTGLEQAWLFQDLADAERFLNVEAWTSRGEFETAHSPTTEKPRETPEWAAVSRPLLFHHPAISEAMGRRVTVLDATLLRLPRVPVVASGELTTRSLRPAYPERVLRYTYMNMDDPASLLRFQGWESQDHWERFERETWPSFVQQYSQYRIRYSHFVGRLCVSHTGLPTWNPPD